MHRVELLADREEDFSTKGPSVYYSIIPLPEILSETQKAGVNTKTVNSAYMGLLEKLGNEFDILMNTSLKDIEKAGSPLIGEAVSRMRAGKIHITPGFDGEFGKIKIF